MSSLPARRMWCAASMAGRAAAGGRVQLLTGLQGAALRAPLETPGTAAAGVPFGTTIQSHRSDSTATDTWRRTSMAGTMPRAGLRSTMHSAVMTPTTRGAIVSP